MATIIILPCGLPCAYACLQNGRVLIYITTNILKTADHQVDLAFQEGVGLQVGVGDQEGVEVLQVAKEACRGKQGAWEEGQVPLEQEGTHQGPLEEEEA